MGQALDKFRKFLESKGIRIDKKSATSLFVLFILLLLLPLGIYFIRQRVSFLPRAAGELIQLGDGGCIVLSKDKTKAVDCPQVPLKLVNPFFNVSAANPSSSVGTNSPAPSTSQSPSPVPSSSTGNGSPQNVSVGSFNNNIQQALDSIKTSGGSVFLPAGNYEITEKVRLYSNTTLFGEGMGQTVIKFADGSFVDDMVANDSTSGQQNIVVRDLTLQGPDVDRANTNCCYGLKLENLNGGYVINVEVNDVGMDGILLGYKIKNGTAQGVSNVRVTGCKVARSQRQQIGFTSGNNVVIDNCTIDGTNKFGASAYVGIDLEPDTSTTVTNSYVLSNNVSNSNIGIALNGANGESGNADSVKDNKVCSNNASGAIMGISDSGSNNTVTSEPCDMPGNLSNLPAAPSRPTADNSILQPEPASAFDGLVKDAFAQDSDDVFIDGEDSDSSDQFVNGSAGGNQTASGSGKLLYRLAETQAGLQQARWKEFALGNEINNFSFLPEFPVSVLAQDSDDVFIEGEVSDSPDQFVNGNTNNATSSGTASFSIGKQFINTVYQLKDTKPGTKQIWVQFLHPDGATKVDSKTFDLLEQAPQIAGISCNLDVSKDNLKITIEGLRFSNNIGTVESVSPAAKPEVIGWNNTEVVAMLKKPSIPINEGQKFKIKVVRADGVESGIATCAVDKSLVSLGARIFCREPGKFDASNVVVNLIYSADEKAQPDKVNKIEEKVTINADGEIQNLKTKLQVGKNYGISIKAPSSLRRTSIFTAMEGTTQISTPDGKPFILPIGDIAPVISTDGAINTLDRAELLRQWRVLGNDGGVKLTGDFNRDGRVNSIDWACMNYDFGAEDDPLPVSIPQPASGTIRTGGASNTITIPGGSSTPRPSTTASATPVPSPSKDTTNSAKIDLGGKVFLDTNRNQIADDGESFITAGSAVIQLLQVPDSHETGASLTAEEFAEAKILSNSSNNLTGGNYDISVFVEKDSGGKFSLVTTANAGQLTGQYDFVLNTPLTNSSQVINIPVTAPTQ